jgi:hypothetical protein
VKPDPAFAGIVPERRIPQAGLFDEKAVKSP